MDSSASRAAAPRAAIRLGAFPALAVLVLAAASCVPDPAPAPLLPVADLSPPAVLEAGPAGPRSFVLRFDEAVAPVSGSFALDPPLELAAFADGQELRIEFAEDLSPGADYIVVGEAEDSRGNGTRFLFRFPGWNGRPAALRLSELQAARNDTKTRPHRDYAEFLATGDGNLGGIELSWTSTVKTASYRFPGAEVRAGDYIVLHLSPQGLPEEKDETGRDTALSGGVDATPGGRDFWCAALALPDENGALALRQRPGGPIAEGFFYADQDRSGQLGDDRLAAFVLELAAGGAWPLAGGPPAWEDALRWNPSSARSLNRAQGTGPESWFVSAAGAQSPGAANPPGP